jgi:transcriptional regulator with XRE-family HTH domain
MPTTSPNAVEMQLRRAVKTAGLSLSLLAKKAKVSHAQLSRFVRGERSLLLPAVSRLCHVLGLRLAFAEEDTWASTSEASLRAWMRENPY